MDVKLEHVAFALRCAQPFESDPSGYDDRVTQWRRTVEQMIYELKRNNPSMDCLKFAEDCGYELPTELEESAFLGKNWIQRGCTSYTRGKDQ